MPAPTLSVVVPTYNRWISLQKTLQGLARQGQNTPFPAFEAIVVSDGSTDDTHEGVAALAPTLPFSLRLFVQENAGPARARNRGTREASAPVIVYLDDDVEPAPGFLAAHHTWHQRDSQIVVIGPMAPDPVRHKQEAPWIAWEHAMLQKQYAHFQDGSWPSAGPNHFYSGNASVRREHVLAVGGFNERYTRQEDVELACRLARERHTHFVFEPKAHGIHRPSRPFASWLKVPLAYGNFDVQRAQAGDVSWDVLRIAYLNRNRLTRRLADWVVPRPALRQPVRTLLRALSVSLYRVGLESPGLATLSALYNLAYLEAATDTLGSFQTLLDIMRADPPSPHSHTA